jgi:hypothetical protein
MSARPDTGGAISPGAGRARLFHEAGHAIMARAIGFTIVSVSRASLHSVPPGSGRLRRGLDYAEGLALVGLAGQAAETLSGEPARESPDDIRRISDLLAASCSSEEEINRRRAVLARRARRTLQQPHTWRQVEAVVLALTERSSLSGEELEAILSVAAALQRSRKAQPKDISRESA